jgi:hypothetical protein
MTNDTSMTNMMKNAAGYAGRFSVTGPETSPTLANIHQQRQCIAHCNEWNSQLQN